MALGSELEKFFSKSFFLGREISFIHFFFQVHSLLVLVISGVL